MSYKKTNKGVGQYDLEYSFCPCFWGTEPAKYAKLIPGLVSGGSVLDLGAGEGKNSIYLAELGFRVTAVEISEYAIQNFEERLKALPPSVKDKIQIIHEDVINFISENKFDVIIAYGLLHCLSSTDDVNYVINNIKKLINSNGLIVIVSFNNEMSVPEVQNYLEPTLLSKTYLKESFQEFQILEYEEDIITETHPTTNIEHQHSLTRIIAKKI